MIDSPLENLSARHDASARESLWRSQASGVTYDRGIMVLPSISGDDDSATLELSIGVEGFEAGDRGRFSPLIGAPMKLYGRGSNVWQAFRCLARFGCQEEEGGFLGNLATLRYQRPSKCCSAASSRPPSRSEITLFAATARLPSANAIFTASLKNIPARSSSSFLDCRHLRIVCPPTGRPRRRILFLFIVEATFRPASPLDKAQVFIRTSQAMAAMPLTKDTYRNSLLCLSTWSAGAGASRRLHRDPSMRPQGYEYTAEQVPDRFVLGALKVPE